MEGLYGGYDVDYNASHNFDHSRAFLHYCGNDVGWTTQKQRVAFAYSGHPASPSYAGGAQKTTFTTTPLLAIQRTTGHEDPKQVSLAVAKP